MKKLFILMAIFILFLGGTLHYFVAFLGESTLTSPTQETTPPFPSDLERTTVFDDYSEPPATASPVAQVEMNSTIAPAPGGLIVPSITDRVATLDLLSRAQPLPDNTHETRYLLHMTEAYTAHMLPYNTHEWIVDIVLSGDHIFYERMLAESYVAGLLGWEREDLCGIPFDIHTEAAHPAFSLGNLGLEACGADKLAGTEWEVY